LGNFDQAQRFFEKSMDGMFNPITLWKGTGQVDWLVVVCILAGTTSLYPKVRQALDDYAQTKTTENFYLYFANVVMELLLPLGTDTAKLIEALLSKPKFKDTYTSGLVLQAILNHDQSNFTKALEQLLKVHEGKAIHGELRSTPEGLLCMPAMALAYIAIKNKLKIEIENDYLSIDYLDRITGSAPAKIN
jgi:hypothetical protein